MVARLDDVLDSAVTRAVRDDLRDMLVPINKKYPLPVLMKALREYPLPKRRRITIDRPLSFNLGLTTVEGSADGWTVEEINPEPRRHVEIDGVTRRTIMDGIARPKESNLGMPAFGRPPDSHAASAAQFNPSASATDVGIAFVPTFTEAELLAGLGAQDLRGRGFQLDSAGVQVLRDWVDGFWDEALARFKAVADERGGTQ